MLHTKFSINIRKGLKKDSYYKISLLIKRNYNFDQLSIRNLREVYNKQILTGNLQNYKKSLNYNIKTYVKNKIYNTAYDRLKVLRSYSISILIKNSLSNVKNITLFRRVFSIKGLSDTNTTYIKYKKKLHLKRFIISFGLNSFKFGESKNYITYIRSRIKDQSQLIAKIYNQFLKLQDRILTKNIMFKPSNFYVYSPIGISSITKIRNLAFSINKTEEITNVIVDVDRHLDYLKPNITVIHSKSNKLTSYPEIIYDNNQLNNVKLKIINKERNESISINVRSKSKIINI